VKSLRPTYFQKVQQKRYASRSFRNPYFRSKDAPPWVLIAVSMTVLVCIFGGTGALFSLPALAIRSIGVHGNETVSTETLTQAIHAYLQERKLLIFRRANRFLFDAPTLKEKLQAQFSFEAVTIEQNGTDVHVRVRERQSELLWKAGDAVFVVDLSGQVIRALSLEEIARLNQPEAPSVADLPLSPTAKLKRLAVFKDVNRVSVGAGASVMKPEEVNGVLRFHQSLLDLAIPFVETRVDRMAGKWMAVKTLTGYDILFDPLSDPNNAATRLQTLLHETVKDPKVLLYVDLRFGDHVYYK